MILPLEKVKKRVNNFMKKINVSILKKKLKNKIKKKKKKKKKKTSSPLCCKFAEPNSRIDFKGEVTISYSLHSV